MNDRQTPRTLMLCDIENQVPVHPRFCSSAQARLSMRQIIETARLLPSDLVVIACSPTYSKLMFGAWAERPGALRRCRRGIDGADRALVDEADDAEGVARRFDRVVIGSGDGIFTDLVVALNEHAVDTEVIAYGSRLSRRLRMAASIVHLLPEPGPHSAAA